MGYLSVIEKKIICRLFDISNGFVFKSLYDKGKYNKTTTKELILDSCGIDIYKDEEYRELSQQRCIEKIWNESTPSTIAKLLTAFSNYFTYQMETAFWADLDRKDFEQVAEIIKKLENTTAVELPSKIDLRNLEILLEDIEHNFRNGKPEMTLDRLHTFTTEYFRSICISHNISTVDDKGKELALHSLVGSLKNWYRENNYFDSDFCIVAIQNTVNIFDRFNAIRNNHSAAHPNEILNRVEAEYAVQVVSSTLKFIDKIETIKRGNQVSTLITKDTDDLPF